MSHSVLSVYQLTQSQFVHEEGFGIYTDAGETVFVSLYNSKPYSPYTSH
jgi:hypothetical protein